MDKIDDGLIASTFAKVKDVDIFALKAYMEITHGAETGAQSILLDVFVNFPFFLFNLIVGLFSVILRFFENFSLYDTYKQTVYHSSQKLWENLSGNGSYTSSLLYLLVAISAFSIFISYLFSKGDFSKRLIHLFVVIILGMGYFGTIQSTSGGIYILDTVHQLAGSFSDAVTNLSLDNPSGGKTKITHLFVNTGQLNGKFHNNQTGKEEKFDNEQVLGKYDKSGKFITPKQKDILNYTDNLGDKATEGEEKNRWLSAVNDYLWIKSGYVILKIFEAVILAVPLILIQLIALLVSFLPRMQDIIFNVLKVMFGAVSFPALAGFLTLIVFYTQTLIATFVKKKFTDGSLLSGSNFKGQAILFMLLITVFVQGCVFWGIWKYKETFLRLIIGSRASQVINQSVDKINEKAENLGITPKSIYERAHDMSSLAMMGAGYGVGTMMNAQDNWNAFKERQQANLDDGQSKTNDADKYDEANADDTVISKEAELTNEGEYQSELPKEASKRIEQLGKESSYELSFISEGNSTEEILKNVKSDNHTFQEGDGDTSLTNQDMITNDIENHSNNYTSPLKQRKLNKLEGELSQFNSDVSMTKNHGKNAFEKGFNASKTKEVRKQHNLERQSKVLEELEKLREGK